MKAAAFNLNSHLSSRKTIARHPEIFINMQMLLKHKNNKAQASVFLLRRIEFHIKQLQQQQTRVVFYVKIKA
jgi:hypothetical protein